MLTHAVMPRTATDGGPGQAAKTGKALTRPPVAARAHASIRNILRGPAVQPKLRIGATNDPAEREADAVADKVMRMPAPEPSATGQSPLPPPSLGLGSGPNPIRRMCEGCEDEIKRQPIDEKDELEVQRMATDQGGEVDREELIQPKEVPGAAPALSAASEGTIRGLGVGAPLARSERAFFEPRFGRDFSDVRIHTGSAADVSARAINARAFTLGSEIAFARGEYTPGSPPGRRLLAHELAHTVQQGTVCGREESRLVKRQVAGPQRDRSTASVQRAINSAIEEMDRGDPSFKALLSGWLLASKHKGLRQFGLALAERSHPKYGTYLNGFLVYLHARGSKRIAELVVAEFSKAGLGLLKLKEQPQGDKSLPGATGAGLGSILTYEGKTLVKMGGTEFYISGKPPDYWKGKTTSVLFIVNKNQPKKMYRLDFDVLKKGPKAGLKGWEHNQKGVAKVLGLEVTNHQPAGGWARAAGRAIRVFKWGGRALFVVGIGSELIEIYFALDRTRAVLGAISSLGGAAAGALSGASAGIRLGSRGGAWGAAGGGLFGGFAGGWAASKLAKAATHMAYDYFVTPLVQEDWIAFDETQVELQLNPVEEEEIIRPKEAPGAVPALSVTSESAIRGLGGGAPLPSSERAFFEPRFGRDFSDVRIHTGTAADQSARLINARAFTLGSEIAFAGGEYAPGTPSGRRLLAHELTHTLQQGAAGAGGGCLSPMLQLWSVDKDTAVSDSESDTLWELSRSITGYGRNWPCIRPVRMQSPKATGERYPFMIWRGDEFDVSNLIATTGVSLRIHLFSPTDEPKDAGIASRFYPGAISSPSGDVDVDIETAANAGATPIHDFLIFGHAVGGSMFGGAIKHDFAPSNLIPEPANFELAERGFFPRRCWFTRNAAARAVGCNSTEFGTDFAAVYLRRGASITTTTASVRPRCEGLANAVGVLLRIPGGCAWFNGLDFAASPAIGAATLEGPFWNVADFHAGAHWATINDRL